MSAPVRQRERRAIPLNMIVGRSPANCRAAAPDADADVAGLAVSIDAIGLIQPLLVSAVPGPRLLFHVDAGGRRLAALRQLVDRAKLGADAPVECEVLVADEGLSREISLAENTMRRDLHPADECTSFEAMRAAGLSEEKIAADFGLTVRHVRQRLKLTKLSPRVRAAWRDGTLTTEVAQALTLAPSHEAQDAVLDGPDKWMLRNHHQVRLHFLKGVVEGRCPEAVYVGIDAYCAAGGAIDENLFQEYPLLLDPALLTRLAREKMIRAGEAILQEHGFFGFCMVRSDVEQPWTWPRIVPDVLPAERERLQAIDEEADRSELDDEKAEAARLAVLAAEETAIRHRAIARASTEAVRATAGIFVDLDHDGQLVVELGVQQPKAARGAAAESDQPTASGLASTVSASSPKPDPVEAAGAGRGMVRTILEATIEKAMIGIVGHRPDLALLFLVARYGGSYRPDWITSDGFGLAPFSKLEAPVLPSVSGKSFDQAIAACADAPLADLLTASCAIVARAIRLDKHAVLGSLEALMHAFGRRGAALGPAFVAAMDYDAYFAAATRAACLHALEAMETPLVDRQAKKPALAALAAAEAAKKQWLPFPLAGWAAVQADSAEAEVSAPAMPLAQAMGHAIYADDLRREIGLLTYLTMNVVEHPGGVLSRNALCSAYRNAQPANPYTSDMVADALFELGFEGEPAIGGGFSYVGYGFADRSDEAAR